MPETNKTKNIHYGKDSQNHVSSCQVPLRITFKQAIDKAKSQVDLNCFCEEDKSFAAEIISNIAEVYLLADSSPIRIAKEEIDGYIVKQVFEEVTSDHVQLVIDNFRKIDYIVKFKKSYIRTALYNAVFEQEAHYINLVRHDCGI